MTKLELLRLLRLLSGIETAMLCKAASWPDHLIDDLEHFMGIVEREVLGNGNCDPTM